MSVTDVTGRFPIPLKWPRLPMDLNKVDAIVIHHTAVDPQSTERGQVALIFPAAEMSMEDELNHIAVIHLYHKSLGWGGFGYHLIVFPSGRAYLVTSLWQWGAHVAGENDHLLGIVFAGDFTARLPGGAQIEGGRECVSLCTEDGDLPINPHKAYGGTTCPGRVVEILNRLVPEEEDTMKIYGGRPSGAIYIVSAVGKRHISPTELSVHKKAGLPTVWVPDADLLFIPNIQPSGAVDYRKVVEAVQQALRDGTG